MTLSRSTTDNPGAGAPPPVDDFTAVLSPIDTARGLGNAHYVSAGMFARERDEVLFATWAGIGFGKDVPVPGDVKPIDFLGMPLLLARDLDGDIRVFQNTCRHRGMILFEEPTRVKAVIRCPYHSWCYRMDGSLRSTPHVGGVGNHTHAALDRDHLGLFTIRSHVWRDVVFVNVSGQAPTFEDYAAPLIERWREYDQPLMHGGENSSVTLTVQTNWKLAVENYCESYHLPFVHPTLNTYSRLQDHYHIEEPGYFSGQGSLVYRQLRGENDMTFPDFSDLSDQWDTGAEYVALYPNVLFGVHRDHAFAIVLDPVDVERTVENIEIYYTPDGASSPELDELRLRNAMQWKQVFSEDIGVVEGMQRGRHGQLFDGGRFAPAMDGPTHRFHQWMATRLSQPA